MFCMVLLVTTVSAAQLEFDNVKGKLTIDETTSKYGKIEIKDNFGFVDLISLELKKNTDSCGQFCYAEKEIILYQETSLVDDIKFELINKGDITEVDIINYSLSIKNGTKNVVVNDYYQECNDVWIAKNSSFVNRCERISNGTHIEVVDNFIPYAVGEVLPIGTYVIRLEGEKDPFDSIDWIIKTNGRWIDEWAVWKTEIFNDFESGGIPDSLHTYRDACDSGSPWAVTAGTLTTTCEFLSAQWDLGVQLNHNMTYNWSREDSSWIMNITWDIGGSDPNREFRIGWAENVTTSTIPPDVNWFGSNFWSTTVAADKVILTWKTNKTAINILKDGILQTSFPHANSTFIPTIWMTAGSGETRSMTLYDSLQILLNGIVISESPEDNTITLLSGNSFNCSAETFGATNLVNISLLTNISGSFVVSNSSIVTGTNNNSIMNLTIPEGDTIWSCQACDNEGDCGVSENRTITLDVGIPIVSVISPTGDQGTFVSGINLTLTWNATDPNLQACFYEYEGVNTTVTCSQNSTNLTVTDSSLTSLLFYANDTLGNLGVNSTNWSYSFIETNVSFNVNVSETSLQDFQINLSTSINVLSISSFLDYDGNSFLSTSSCTVNNNCTINNRIDIPLITSGESELKDFFWNITIFNGTDSIEVITSTRQQNVSRIRIEQCNATFTNQALNFTALDEQNFSRISPFTFDATFDFWAGSGVVKRTNSFANSSAIEINLCTEPTGSLFTDAIIEYSDVTNVTYTPRNYFFQNNTISNINQNISLYLLQSGSSTTFILKVQDQNLLPVPGVLITIERYDPGNDEFNVVQIAKTDDNGATVGFFETEVVDYRFIISRDDETLLTTTQQKIVGEAVPFTLIFTIGQVTDTPWSNFGNITNLTSSLLFNSTSEVVTYTYEDLSTLFEQGRLLVQLNNPSNTTNAVICNVTSAQASAQLTCDVSAGLNASYVARGFITRDGNESEVNVLVFLINVFAAIVGNLGLLMGLFLMLVASFTFKFNEIAGVWMVVMTAFFVNMFGLINFGMLAIMGFFAIAIIITIQFGR